ncbi:hypothetical protein N7512_000388 [Penicillium capsulatum]|nr:hypothetical protein N7512_000388 [Penicillium capsulatum]
MALRLLVNTGLLAIPIGGAVGTLLGLDAHRSATGQPPLFTSDGHPGTGGSTGGHDSTGGGASHPGTTNNGVTTKTYCDLSFGVSPPTQGESFTFNPNQWGVTDSTNGGLCMNVTTFNNETYATKNTAPEFSVTWQFDAGPNTQPVHAYSNLLVENVLPLTLEKISEINLDLHWTYGVGNTPAESTDDATLKANDLATNVAVDMFFDTDQKKAQNSSLAGFEVMVWFADYGASAQPFGLDKGAVTTKTIEGAEFSLYADTHTVAGGDQHVLTWVATEATEKFHGDLYPLITDLYTLKGETYPAKDDYMGIFQFGTEAFSSKQNVTFWCPTFSLDIKS